MSYPGIAALLALSAFFLTGCTISDGGCAADAQCREGRICENHQCIWLGDAVPATNNGVFNNGTPSDNNDASGENNGSFNNGENNGSFNNGENNGSFNNGENNGSFNNGENNGSFNNGENNEPGDGVIGGGETSCEHLSKTSSGRMQSGLYRIEMADGDVEVVYCWFDEFDQGWTLIARSGSSPSGAEIGWKADVGRPSGDGAYSLDLSRVRLRFTEMLISERSDADDANAVGPNAYAVRPFPGNFVDGWGDRATARMNLTRVRGSCAVSRVQNLRFFGYTDDVASAYFMGDNPMIGDHGLTTRGFEFGEGSNPTCYSGLLHGKHGLLFVR